MSFKPNREISPKISTQESIETISFEQAMAGINPEQSYNNFLDLDYLRAQKRYNPEQFNTIDPIYKAKLKNKKVGEVAKYIYRWCNEKEITEIASTCQEFKQYGTDYEKTINACEASRFFWGDDGNVIGHPVELLKFMKVNYPLLFTDPTIALITRKFALYHDKEEDFLLENGYPKICDHKTGTKTEDDRQWQQTILVRIINDLPIASQPLKDFLIATCNKERWLGYILAAAEKGLFKKKAEDCLDLIHQVQNGRPLTFIDTLGQTQTITGETLNKLLEYNFAIATECLGIENCGIDDKYLIKLIELRKRYNFQYTII